MLRRDGAIMSDKNSSAEVELDASNFADADIAYFDPGSPIALLPPNSPQKLFTVAGIRRGKISGGGVPKSLWPLPNTENNAGAARTSLIGELRARGVEAVDIGEELPTALLATFLDHEMTCNTPRARRLWAKLRKLLPYCLQEESDGHFHLHNHDHQDLGIVVLTVDDPRRLVGVWHRSASDGQTCWFFDDEWSSRKGYFRRLAKLAAHVAPDDPPKQ